MEKSKEFLHYKSNREKAIEYFKQQGLTIKSLIMSNRAHNVLQREKINYFYQLIKFYPDRINEFWGVGEKTISEICDMVVKVVDMHFENIEALKITKTVVGVDKTELYSYFNNLYMPIEELNLSQRTYNSLKRENINYLHDALEFYPDGFADFWSMGVKSINEINNIIHQIAQEYLNSTGSSVEQKTTNQYDKVLSCELEKNKFIECVKAKKITVEDLKLSVRSSNALRRENIHFLHEAISFYPDGFDKIRNLGVKSINEIKKCVEVCASNYSSEIEVFA